MSNKDDHGLSNAIAGYDNIREMVAAVDCDYDRLEELRDERDGLNTEINDAEQDSAQRIDAQDALMDWMGTNAEELAELEKAAGEHTSQDDARERIQEDALEICVRTGWHSPTGDRVAPEEFYILLTTGGPALRIHGELSEHCEPSRAWLEYQDWGTPWTHLVTDSDGGTVCQATLLTYAQQFYFGEG